MCVWVCMCLCICVVTVYACSCICPNMSVCLYQQELRFCRIWMKVWVMAPVSILSFLPSGLHLSLSSPHVGTYVDVTATLLGLQYAYHMIRVHGWASLLPYHERLYLQQRVFKKVIHFQSGCLSTTKTIIIAFLTSDIQEASQQDASKTFEVIV